MNRPLGYPCFATAMYSVILTAAFVLSALGACGDDVDGGNKSCRVSASFTCCSDHGWVSPICDDGDWECPTGFVESSKCDTAASSAATSTNTVSSTQTNTSTSTSTHTATSTASATATSTGTATATFTGTSTATNCGALCEYAYACGVDQGRCPGFYPGCVEEAYFLYGIGSIGCIAMCETEPATMASMVDLNSCDTTISQLSANVTDFAFVCAGDFCT